MLDWIRRRDCIIVGIVIEVLFAILTVAAVGDFSKKEYQGFPQDLKTLIVLSIIVGSMGLVVFGVTLYYQIRAFHLWTDIDTPSLTKETPVSP